MRRALAVTLLAVALGGACAADTGTRPPAAAPSGTVTTIDTRRAPSSTTTTVAGRAPVGRLTAVTLMPSSGAPLVVSDAGNSLLFDAEPAIAAMLGEARFVPHTIGGFGLSVLPELWRGVFGNDVPGDEAAAVVVLLGNRDFAAASADPDGYRTLLDEAVGLLSSRGTRVIWLGMPPMPSAADERGRHAVNALFAELPDRFPGVVRYVPTDGILGDDNGAFVRSIITESGASVPIRKVKPDGTDEQHLCPEGAIRIANLVRAELAAIVAVPPAPAGWEQDGWRQDPRYDDPPGGCRA